MYPTSWSDDWSYEDSPTEGIPPEWPGDIREASAGCWHETNSNHNSPMFDADYCRKPCVPGTRYCEEHQRQPEIVPA